MTTFHVWRWQASPGVWIDMAEYDDKREAEALADSLCARETLAVVMRDRAVPATPTP